jgi:hypothetical protein
VGTNKIKKNAASQLREPKGKLPSKVKKGFDWLIIKLDERVAKRRKSKFSSQFGEL